MSAKISAPPLPDCSPTLANLIQVETETRLALHLTQAQLAQRMHTTQSIISCFERGQYNPSLRFLERMAEALGKEVSVSLGQPNTSNDQSNTEDAPLSANKASL